MAANVSLTLRVAERAPIRFTRPEWWSFLQRAPRPSKHRLLIERATPGAVIRASGEAISYAVAVTDRELLIGRARWFGSSVERYNLNRLQHVRRIANRDIDVLQLEFAGMPPSSVVVLYESRARAAFADIIARLQRRIPPLTRRAPTRPSIHPGRRAHLRLV